MIRKLNKNNALKIWSSRINYYIKYNRIARRRMSVDSVCHLVTY